MDFLQSSDAPSNVTQHRISRLGFSHKIQLSEELSDQRRETLTTDWKTKILDAIAIHILIVIIAYILTVATVYIY